VPRLWSCMGCSIRCSDVASLDAPHKRHATHARDGSFRRTATGSSKRPRTSTGGPKGAATARHWSQNYRKGIAWCGVQHAGRDGPARFWCVHGLCVSAGHRVVNGAGCCRSVEPHPFPKREAAAHWCLPCRPRGTVVGHTERRYLLFCIRVALSSGCTAPSPPCSGASRRRIDCSRDAGLIGAVCASCLPQSYSASGAGLLPRLLPVSKMRAMAAWDEQNIAEHA
jgi:hypothetical protein